MSDKAEEPIITLNLLMHVGEGSSEETHHSVEINGRKTNITRHKWTRGGTPGGTQFIVTEHYYKCGDERFDMMETKGAGLQEWLLAHVTPTVGASPDLPSPQAPPAEAQAAPPRSLGDPPRAS